MRQNDLLKSDSGDHLRVLLYGDQQSYVVNCQRCKMPFPISTPSLLQMEKLPQDTYRLLALDEDISECQRQQRDRRAELIAPLMVEECICDKSYRNKVLREIVSNASTSRKTVLQYLWLYWVYQSKNALLPAEKSNAEKRPLSSDEKTIRWALNKFYYTPQRQSLQTAYKMMLRAKYCDAKGKLKPDYPSFWQFRYFFRQHRDPISESISREGIKAYQRNHRPFVGAVSDYAGTIGTYMTDATVADIYIVSRLSRRPIGRPVIYTMVDAYSRLITGVYVGLEGGQYALRLLLQNTFADKVSFCRQHGLEIDPQDWPSRHLPTKITTDRGSEFLGGPLENLCESYGIEIENLPSYRPDLKGVVEKLFDLIQCAYKPLLKGKGVVESDTQERGAPDYRRQGTLDLEQFTAIVLRCVLFYNSQYIQTGFIRTPNMASAGIMPTAAAIWSFCLAQDDCPVSVASDPHLLYALLPRADGKITQRGLELFNLRFSNCTFKKRFVAAGLNGRELVKVAYSPDCLDTVYLYEDGDYMPFTLSQKMYLGKSLAEIADMQQSEKSESANWKRQELQAQIDLMNDIMQIADSAERGISDKGKISPQIQRGRTIARAQEHMSIRFINFLVQLINGAGVSICMVGTPRVLQVLQQEFRSARRTTGLIYDRLPDDKEFSLLLHGLWHYQYTRFATDLTPEMQSWLYRKTQGIPDVLVKLLYNAQKLCILDGREKLDLEVFESAFLKNLGMVSDYMAELATVRVPRPQRETEHSPAAIRSPEATAPHDLRGTLRAAKKSDRPPLDAYSEYGVASSNRTVSVRKILQLACFLGLSLSDLLSPPPEDNTLAEIREMYQQGISMYHIAQLYGTDRKTIARWVKP